ncbi:MAG: Hsp20/alpha crystallin family protein [Desulfobulbaceae bacterium]|uniref:Hsp20/alpha crystallin family protein n=1 Tax=Candidatus Desulfatifera sulfidica TaxID=2841691 RepID=A0A8J6N8R2_9BACT|nr:Hsp20/alpha crystallin family protein [Candidatus Desulfatifera sulfidica]
MDPLSKKIMQELAVMQQSGRMLRNLSLSRMMKATAWQPAVDIYEGDDEILLHLDLAGVDPRNISVLVDEFQVRISGRRQLLAQEEIACVHQLEIEQGAFERIVTLPVQVDGSRAESRYHQGILVLALPKRVCSGKVRITISVEG